jgi:hypothetical protein
MLVDVAGAAVPVSSDLEAVVTMFSSSNAWMSEPASSARAVALNKRTKSAAARGEKHVRQVA